jgi:hypothetical protein
VRYRSKRSALIIEARVEGCRETNEKGRKFAISESELGALRYVFLMNGTGAEACARAYFAVAMHGPSDWQFPQQSAERA